MSCKLFLVLCAVICIAGSLEAASLRGAAAEENTDAVVHKLDYEGVEANMRSARQAYPQDDSGEDSDEDDEEEDAEAQHLNAIRRQQAYEQSVADSQEGSDEDDDDDTEGDDDDDFYGRRLRRDVSEAVSHNEIEEDSKPSENSEDKEKQPAEESTETAAAAPAATPSGSSNTSVLIMIRDAIKKVTDLPNTQQVATSAQQYFQLFEHFLQQTIEQVIGDDDDEDEAESTTIAAEAEKETESESTSADKVTENSTDKTPASETSDKESSAEHVEVPQPEKLTEAANEIKA
ncbi:nucleolin [Calliphora vicina]|uniref:nucleolin n=1 Tax=Calliphora vicina TaxID=7373 RepID=UPI00325B4711